jgi:3-oxoadipate enol-lactonase
MKVIANGIAQYYRRAGKGPPLILIHALGLDHSLWDEQMPPMASAFEVIAYDVRGHGRTDVPNGPYTMADFAEDLEGLLDSLGIASAHLCGISMGGMIAQEFALGNPDRVRSLTLADTTSEYNQEARRQFAERARVAEERGMAALAPPTTERWFTPEFRSQHPEAVARIMDRFVACPPIGYAASCRAISRIDFTERLVTIRVPTLVLVGARDTSTTPEMALKIHEYIPGSRYVELADAAHLTNVARPKEFSELVAETAKAGEPPEEGVA